MSTLHAALATLTLACVTGHVLAAERAPLQKDCTPRDCPELTIQGDAVPPDAAASVRVLGFATGGPS